MVQLCRSLGAGSFPARLLTCAPGPQQESGFELQLYREWNPGRGLNVPLGLGTTLRKAFEKAELVHNHGLWLRINLAAGKEALRRGIRLVVSPRGNLGPEALRNRSWAKRLVWRLGQRELLEKSALIHVTGSTEREAVRAAGILAPVALVPNGIDIPSLSRRLERPRRILLFLARIHPIKGLSTLLEAWSQVEAEFPEWDLRIGGPDNAGHEKEMRELTTKLGIRRAEFLGALFGEAKKQEFSGASVYVLPTKGENFGVTVAEALASAVPVIVTKAAPWSGVEENRCGWWIDAGVEPLLAALRHALSRPTSELAAMGQRGRDWMQREFSWESVASRMAEAYEWVLSGSGRPGFVELA